MLFSGRPYNLIIVNKIFAPEAVGFGIKKHRQSKTCFGALIEFLLFLQAVGGRNGRGCSLGQCGVFSHIAPFCQPAVILPGILPLKPSNVITPVGNCALRSSVSTSFLAQGSCTATLEIQLQSSVLAFLISFLHSRFIFSIQESCSVFSEDLEVVLRARKSNEKYA